MNSERRKYRTEIPNMIDDAGLSVFAVRLYVHIKRVAGDKGKCIQSTRTMAEMCKMSVGKVSASKKELLNAALIKIRKVKVSSGYSDEITIVDVWDENFDVYAPRAFTKESSSVHGSTSERSPHERKKEQGEEKTLEERTKLAKLASLAGSTFAQSKSRKTPIPDDFQITDSMRRWAAKEMPNVDVCLLTDEFIYNALANDLRSSNWYGFWYKWMGCKYKFLLRYKMVNDDSGRT